MTAGLALAIAAVVSLLLGWQKLHLALITGLPLSSCMVLPRIRERRFSLWGFLRRREIERFAATGTGVSHCPRTVIRLGYRMPRIGAMRRAGVPVSIGADGAASNDGGAFVSDLRLALLLHRAGGDATCRADVVRS